MISIRVIFMLCAVCMVRANPYEPLHDKLDVYKPDLCICPKMLLSAEQIERAPYKRNHEMTRVIGDVLKLYHG